MTALLMNMSEQRGKELRDYASSRRSVGRKRPRPVHPGAGLLGEVSIRRLGAADAAAVETLAGRDSSTAPAGDLLGAERAGRLVAAVSITTGESIADPFAASADARALLQRRAAQLRDANVRGKHLRRGLRALSARPRRS